MVMIADRCKLLFCFLIVALLFACSDSDKIQPISNPETVVVGQTVTLAATSSILTDDEINPDDLVFLWEFISKPAGSTASLSDPESAYPSFIADFEGSYVLKLSIFYQGLFLSESEITVAAQPQDPTVLKPESHLSSTDICDSCHSPDNWALVRFDHSQVTEQCASCHQQPTFHISTSYDCGECHNTRNWSAASGRGILLIYMERWESSNIPTYQFTYQCSCLPQGDKVITVAAGVVTEAYFHGTGSMIPTVDLPDLMTINKLFALIDDELQSESRLTVNYNVQYGYPEEIIIFTTDTNTHRVLDFQVVTPP